MKMLAVLSLLVTSTAFAKPVVQDITVLDPANDGTVRAIAEMKVEGKTARDLFETISIVGVANPTFLKSRSLNTFNGDREAFVTNLTSKDGSVRCMKVVTDILQTNAPLVADRYQCVIRIQPINN